MPMHVQIVDVNTWQSGNREDSYNSLIQRYNGFNLRVTGTLDGVTVTIANPFTGANIDLVEGTDWDNDASTLVTLKNLVVAIVQATDTPLQIALNDSKERQPVIDDPANPGEAIGRVDAKILSSAARGILLSATGAGNEANLSVNGTSSPTNVAADNNSMPNAEDQLEAILNNLDPTPTALADVRIEPLGRDGTRFLIYWSTA